MFNNQLNKAKEAVQLELQRRVKFRKVSAWNAIVTESDTYNARWEKMMREGNALEHLRARQMIVLTQEGPLSCEVPELTRMTVQKVIVKETLIKVVFGEKIP